MLEGILQKIRRRRLRAAIRQNTLKQVLYDFVLKIIAILKSLAKLLRKQTAPNTKS